MKRFKRIISLLLAILSVLSFSSCFHDNWNLPEREEPDFNLGALLGLAAPLLSGVETMPSGIVLTLSEDGSYFSVTDASKCTAERVKIPESYKGVPIKKIASSAFKGLEDLSEIIIPSSVISVGIDAFSGCDALKYSQYEGARYLGNAENSYHVLIDAHQSTLISPVIHENTSVIADAAFMNHGQITGIIVPDSVVAIGERAFEGCARVAKVIIGNGVEIIGEKAFHKLSKLEELTFGSSVKNIGKCAFYAASSLETLSLPDGVSEIGEGAFGACSTLRKADLGEVKIIGGFAFTNCHLLNTVNFGNSVERIGEKAFGSCRSLKDVSLPHTVEYIYPDSFEGCDSSVYNSYSRGLYLGNPENPYEYLVGMEEVYPIPDIEASVWLTSLPFTIHSNTRRIAQTLFSEQYISALAINNGKYLTVKYKCVIDHTEQKLIAGIAGASIISDGSVTSIADYAFYGISGLNLKSIPASVTSVGNHAFEGCVSLETITVIGPASIGDYAFANCSSLQSVTYMEQTKSIGDYAFSNCSALAEISIPDSVDYLGQSAFENCSSVIKAYIGSHVSIIRKNTFADCASLASVKLGGELSAISDRAFYNCKSLKYFEFKEGLEYIGEAAFNLCEKLSSAVMPESLTEIGNTAFAGCRKLYTVSLGASLKRIGNEAFGGVPINIEIEYRGTLEMWKKIENAHNLYVGNDKLRVTCTDGEIVLEPDDVIIVLG